MGQRQFTQWCLVSLLLVPVMSPAATTVSATNKGSNGNVSQHGSFVMQKLLEDMGLTLKSECASLYLVW